MITLKKSNVEHLKIYHKEHLSFKTLKDKDFFSFIEKIPSKQEKEVLLESLILLIRSINIHDSFSDAEIDKRINLQIRLAEVSRKLKIGNSLKLTFLKLFKNAYRSTNYVDHFRGEVVEYLFIYLQKSSSSLIYHEPIFKIKRRRLIPRKVLGFDCLVDVVKISKGFNQVDLYECKANLNNSITDLSKKKSPKSPFKRKLSYMNALETEIGKFYCDDCGTKVRVTKNLVSLIKPHKSVPPNYNGFNQIDLLRRFKLGQAIV